MSALQTALSGHDVEVVTYHPGIELDEHGKDLVILSGGGGEGYEINDTYRPGHLWYEDEIEFVKRCQAPVLGICMGFEVICRAFGERVQEMGELIQEFRTFRTTAAGKKLLGREKLTQYKSHEWHVSAVKGTELEVLAESISGVEVIRHKQRPMLATQFHPEVPGGNLSLRKLIDQTVALGR